MPLPIRCLPTLAATLLASSSLAGQSSVGATAARRPVRAADVYRIREVRDPQRSPDGRWVAYVVAGVDTVKDRATSDVWMTSWRGDTTVRLTATPESEHTPRWSPDGRWLSFLSSRGDAKGAQLWLLDRRGGEAQRVSNVRGGISDYAWSPDASRIVLVVGDSASAEDDSTAKPKPIVVDRYHFKSDGSGYLGAEREHLALFDLKTRTSVTLTPGPYEEESPSWSPDGRSIAFLSNRSADPDRSENTDLFVIEARAGATARRLTTFEGPDDGPPAWSPDGKLIAYRQGSDAKYSAYNLYSLAVVPAAGGAPRIVSAALDRSVAEPHWSVDGASLYVIVTDDRTRQVARIPLAGGAGTRVVAGERVVTGLSVGRDGGLAIVATTSDRPHELFAAEGGTLRRLTRHNDEWLSEVRLATTAGITTTSAGGVTVNGLLVTPLDYVAGRRYPTLLRIHGGPNLQDQYEFHLERELFAANGYAVVTANYRGSAGRGAAWSRSIFADWGNREVQDLLAMTDRAVAIGVADSTRLGIGGWSYGAILTNYVIASDGRFRAATSGAGSSLQLAMYGTDEYVIQYDAELGPPWKNQDAWIRVSYPFFHADRITTPTLFLGGDRDFNVPLLGSEQMYQALRSLGVDTRLIVYPGQHHGIARPSFKKDRLERYVAWYDRFLKGTRTAAGP